MSHTIRISAEHFATSFVDEAKEAHVELANSAAFVSHVSDDTDAAKTDAQSDNQAQSEHTIHR